MILDIDVFFYVCWVTVERQHLRLIRRLWNVWNTFIHSVIPKGKALLTVFSEFVGNILIAGIRKDFTRAQPRIPSKVKDEGMTTGNFVCEFHGRRIIFIRTFNQLIHVRSFIERVWERTEHIVKMFAGKYNEAIIVHLFSADSGRHSKQVLVKVKCG